jgi:large subunit ribosomal protein L23
MNIENLMDVLRAPVVSEKATLMQGNNQYAFKIAPQATKQDVKAAVEKLFNVKVEGVQVVNLKGKTKTFRGRAGVRNGVRKAYVRLAKDQTIDLTLL